MSACGFVVYYSDSGRGSRQHVLLLLRPQDSVVVVHQRHPLSGPQQLGSAQVMSTYWELADVLVLPSLYVASQGLLHNPAVGTLAALLLWFVF